MLGSAEREDEGRRHLRYLHPVSPALLTVEALTSEHAPATQPPTQIEAPPLFGQSHLPYESAELLCDVCREHGVDPVFRAHAPSLTAAEKDRIVAPARVQKTVTIELDGVFVLCTAIGDAVLSRATLREVAQRLGLARGAAKRTRINPPQLDPLAWFEMAPGMVSPFLRPGRETAIRALVLIDDGAGPIADNDRVAVSLSLRWSLLVDAVRFPEILQAYARQAYPRVEWVDLRSSGARASA